MKNYKNVDEYIKNADPLHKEKLEAVRSIVLGINKKNRRVHQIWYACV